MKPKTEGLNYLFEPKSIAIIGASSNFEKIGGRPIKFLLEAGYEGKIFPVNPKYDDIAGINCYSAIEDIEEEVESVIIALPGKAVISTLKNCGKAGVRSVIIFSAGFAEISDEGKKAQEEITRIANLYNMRVLGPNSLGLANLNKGIYSMFSSGIQNGMIGKGGDIGIVSQSGALISHLYTLGYEKDIKYSIIVATGNEADVNVADCIAYLAEDNNTKVIAFYLEGIKDGEKLIDALTLARNNNKPVIAIKVGRSSAGQKAAMSHTGSLVGEDFIYNVIFKREGVYRAETLEEFIEIANACSSLPIPKGNKVGIFTVSGGVGILMADQLSESGLSIKEPAQEVQDKLLELVPYASVKNPFDTTAQVINEPHIMEEFLSTLLKTNNLDISIIFLSNYGLNKYMIEKQLVILEKIKNQFPESPIILVSLMHPDMKKKFTKLGYIVVNDPSQAVTIVKGLVYFSDQLSKSSYEVIPLEEKQLQLENISSNVLTEHDGKKIVKEYNIPVTKEKLVQTKEKAKEYAEILGYPIVMKGMSPQIAHKSEKGLVHLGIKNSYELEKTFDIITEKIYNFPDAEYEGILIQELLEPALVEVIIGSKNDPIFGPMIMVGLGGIFVEVFEDISIRKAPVSTEESEEMLKELQAFPLLQGARGQKLADVKALSKAISDVSKFSVEHVNSIEEVDINPLMVYPEGRGVRAADVLISLKK